MASWVIGVGVLGYNTLSGKSKRGLGDILKLNGYNTSWYGKNHNVPDWHTRTGGALDLWPVGLGFEYFYGFIGGDTSQWAPAVVENTRLIEPPHNDPHYNFDRDMADKAITRIRMQKAGAEEAVLCLLRHGDGPCSLHHAPKEWIVKFKGKFDTAGTGSGDDPQEAAGDGASSPGRSSMKRPGLRSRPGIPSTPISRRSSPA